MRQEKQRHYTISNIRREELTREWKALPPLEQEEWTTRHANAVHERRQEQRLRDAAAAAQDGDAGGKVSRRENLPDFIPPWNLCNADQTWPIDYPDIKFVQDFCAAKGPSQAGMSVEQRREPIIKAIEQANPNAAAVLRKQYRPSLALKEWTTAKLGQIRRMGDFCPAWDEAQGLLSMHGQIKPPCSVKHRGLCEFEHGGAVLDRCTLFFTWWEDFVRNQNDSDRYRQWFVLAHHGLRLWVPLRIGGGTLHSSGPVFTFFPLKKINEVDGVRDHVAAAPAGAAEGRLSFYTLPDGLEFPSLPRNVSLQFALTKGPRCGHTEPVMLTQHELAIALDPVAPSDSWRCLQVHGCVKPNAARNDFIVQGEFEDAEDLGVCSRGAAAVEAAEEEEDPEDMPIAEVIQHDIDAVFEGRNGSKEERRSMAVIRCPKPSPGQKVPHKKLASKFDSGSDADSGGDGGDLPSDLSDDDDGADPAAPAPARTRGPATPARRGPAAVPGVGGPPAAAPAGAAGPAPAAAPPPPAPVAPPVAPPVVLGGRPGRGGARAGCGRRGQNGHGPGYLQVEVPGRGFLVYNGSQINAHCSLCDSKCHLNRTTAPGAEFGYRAGQGRPLGHALAWLHAEPPDGEPRTTDWHNRQKHPLSLQASQQLRLAARQAVQGDDSFEPLRQQERPTRDGEDLEPLRIPYP